VRVLSIRPVRGGEWLAGFFEAAFAAEKPSGRLAAEAPAALRSVMSKRPNPESRCRPPPTSMRPRAGCGRRVRTPLISSPVLDALTGARVFLKAETLQRTGSFKFPRL